MSYRRVTGPGQTGARVPSPGTSARGSQKWRTFSAIALTYFTIVASTSMTFIVLAAIADDFGVTLGAVGWVVIVESLIISALLLPMGGVGDSVGRRRVLLVGMGIFGTGSVLTGLAPSFALLIVARIVMAFGNTMVQSIATGLLIGAFPDDERGLAMGAQTTAVAVGSLSGPLLGGVLLGAVGWETLFLLLAIPTAVATATAWILIEPDDADRPRLKDAGFDQVGGLLAAMMITVLVLTINNPFDFPWISPAISIGALVSVGLLIGFVRWELSVEKPMLELRLFAIPTFRWAVIIRTGGFVSATTMTFLLPVYLLSLREISTAKAGLILAFAAVGLGSAAQVSGRLFDQHGARRPTMFGLTLLIAVSLFFGTAGEGTALWLLAIAALLHGIAVGFWNVPNNSAMMAATPAHALGVGGAFTNVTRTIGNVLGQAIAAAVVVAVMRSQNLDIPLGDIDETPGAGQAFVDGWAVAFWVAGAVAALTLLASTRLPRH